MRPDELRRFFHDLRAPLARAKSYGKLLTEADEPERKELERQLMKALEDLEELIGERDPPPG